MFCRRNKQSIPAKVGETGSYFSRNKELCSLQQDNHFKILEELVTCLKVVHSVVLLKRENVSSTHLLEIVAHNLRPK